MSRIVVTRSILETGLAPLNGHDVEVVRSRPGDPALDEERLIEVATGADALITMLTDPLTERVFAALPPLKVVAQYAVGFDNIDVEAARRHGVVVTNTPGVLTDATADLAFTLLLAAARRITEADRYVREGKFLRWETDVLLGTDMKDKVMGIVGMGRIGTAMARRARGFGCRIVYYNRHRVAETTEQELAAAFVTLDELLSQSDFVSLHAPLNAESRHLIDEAALRRMKPTSILINTARGAVVDEAALAAALRERHIAAAGLDVFEREPEVHSELLKSGNVVLAPHLGSATVETRTRMGVMCAESVLAALRGDREVPYRIA